MRDNEDSAYGIIARLRKRPQAPCLILRNHCTPVAFYVRPENQFTYFKDNLLDHGRVPRLQEFAGKFRLAACRVRTKARG